MPKIADSQKMKIHILNSKFTFFENWFLGIILSIKTASTWTLDTLSLIIELIPQFMQILCKKLIRELSWFVLSSCRSNDGGGAHLSKL